MFKKLNTGHLQVDCNRYSVNSNNPSTLRKSTIVAHRLSVHLQNIILTPSKNPQKYIHEINNHIALFRDLLILVGQAKDCPELREKIRKIRCTLVEESKSAVEILVSQVKSSYTEYSIADNRHLVLLFHLLQLFLRELSKNYRLVQVIPMDMKSYYENRAGPSNLGNVISEILLCKQISPDFAQEELSSISIDSQEIALLLSEIQNYIPQELNSSLDIHNSWPLKRKRNFKIFSLLCCGWKSNY